MFNVVVDLCIAFVQYFSTLVDTHEVEFPSAWKDPMYYASTINLGFHIFSEAFPSLRDVRLYFTVISVVGPLVFVLLGLLFLVERLVVLWYFALLAGVMLVLAGVSGSVIASVTKINITSADAQLMLYIGGGLVVFCIVAYLLARRMRASVGVQRRFDIKNEATKGLHVMGALELLLIGVVLIGFALVVSGLIRALDDASNEVNSVGAKFALGIAIAAFVIGILLLLWLIVSLCQAGRVLQWELKQWLQSGFLRILLLSMSLAYIPIGVGIFLMFNCNEFNCQDKFQHLDAGTSIVRNTTKSVCVPCLLGPSQVCPARLQSALCSAKSSNRLEYDTTISCETMRQFFWPAAGLMIVAFVLGVPVMFFSLVQLVTTTLRNEFPVKDVTGAESLPEADRKQLTWLRKAGQTQNVAKFLFQPFEYEYRYVRIFQLIQKLAIVGTTTYVVRGAAESPQMISLGCACAIHFVAFLLLAYNRPFLSKFESGLSILMALLLSIACVMAILLQRGVVIPDPVYAGVIVVNGVVPIAALITGLYLEWHRSRDDDDEKAKEEQARLEALRIEDERLEAEEAAKAAMAAAEGVGEAEAPKEQQAALQTSIGGETTPAHFATPERPSSCSGDERAPAESESCAAADRSALLVVPGLDRMQLETPRPVSRGGTPVPCPFVSPSRQGMPDADAAASFVTSPFRTPMKAETKEERRRRLELRDHFERLAVRDGMAREQELLLEHQGDVDLHIDQKVKRRLQGFLMGGGVVASIALAMCILGLMSRELTVTSHAVAPLAPLELVGYANWTDFTEHCCCLVNKNLLAKSALLGIEKWVCANGRVKERLREIRLASRNATVNGYAVRGMCHTSFAAGCSNPNNAAGSGMRTTCLESMGVDEYTQQKLW